MKKRKLASIGCLCLIGLSGCGFLSLKETKIEKTSGPVEIVDRSTTETKENQSMESVSDNVETMQKEEKIKRLLKDFGRKWSNYTDVYTRNQAVKEHMTERCIKENVMDSDPHVQMKPSGKNNHMTQDTETLLTYPLFGEEIINGTPRQILIQIQLDSSEQKIDEFKVYYVRSSY